jgi:hypothetical protein
MGLFGNAEKRAARKAEKRATKAAARAERVGLRREFLSGVFDKGAAVAGMFAGGANEEAYELNKAMTGDEGTGAGLAPAEKPGMPKWVIPAAVAGVLLFVFMNKKGRR